MKNAVIVGLVGLALVSGAFADMRVIELTVTNNQAITYSDAVVIDGVLESVIIEQTTPGTATVTIANYSGTTAVDTYVSLVDLATATKLGRPMFLPTDNTGTALAAAGGGALSTNYTQVLNIPYQQARLAGGQIKMAVTPKAGLTGASHTVKATIYFRKQ